MKKLVIDYYFGDSSPVHSTISYRDINDLTDKMFIDLHRVNGQKNAFVLGFSSNPSDTCYIYIASPATIELKSHRYQTGYQFIQSNSLHDLPCKLDDLVHIGQYEFTTDIPEEFVVKAYYKWADKPANILLNNALYGNPDTNLDFVIKEIHLQGKRIRM